MNPPPDGGFSLDHHCTAADGFLSLYCGLRTLLAFLDGNVRHNFRPDDHANLQKIVVVFLTNASTLITGLPHPGSADFQDILEQEASEPQKSAKLFGSFKAALPFGTQDSGGFFFGCTSGRSYCSGFSPDFCQQEAGEGIMVAVWTRNMMLISCCKSGGTTTRSTSQTALRPACASHIFEFFCPRSGERLGVAARSKNVDLSVFCEIGSDRGRSENASPCLGAYGSG